MEPGTPGRAVLAGEPATPGRSNNRIESVLRLRPLGAADASAIVTVGPKSIRMVSAPGEDPQQTSQKGQINEFQFDGVLSANASQEDTFKRACIQSGLIKTVMAGQNGILFAYGASGHGKTYTVSGTQQQPGLLPRMLQHLFSVASTPSQGLGDEPMKYMMWISFLEIYNEKVFDLLRLPTEDMPSLKLQEDKKGHVFVKDLTEIRVNNMDEARKCIHDAGKNRAVAETQLNHESSRSHTVFTLKLAQLPANASLEDVKKNPDLMRFSKLSVIDLAGSERVAKSGVQTSEGLKEAGSINSSLLVLSRCIHAMRYNQSVIQKRAANIAAGETGAAKPKPVPFRDSKLTRLFQELFNGQQGKAVMIVNVYPKTETFDEAIQALKFASVAKTVTVGAASAAPTPSTTAKPRDLMQQELSAASRVAPIPFPSLAAASDSANAAPAVAPKAPIDNDDMEVDSDALVDEVIQLREQVLASHRRCTEIEMEVRDEVSRELAAQMIELEQSLRIGFERQIQLIEERYASNWAIMNEQLMEERGRVKQLEDLEAEWRDEVSSLKSQIADAKQQLQEQTEQWKEKAKAQTPLSPIAPASPAKSRKRKAVATEKEAIVGAAPPATKKTKKADIESDREDEPSSVAEADLENEPPKNVTKKPTRGKAKKTAPAEAQVKSPPESPAAGRRTRRKPAARV